MSAFEIESENTSNQTRVVSLLLVFTAVLLTRFSWTPSFLWTDTVNLAYSLQAFDPLRHQPQPPGYPLFVGIARIVDRFTPAPEVTFWLISVVATIGTACILYALASRMATRWVALASVVLLLVNPVFWFGRLRTPLRPWLAFFSALVAYCAWRCWTGDRRFALWGAVALGVGVGFRPDLLAYLLPLWAISSWRGTRSWKAVAEGFLVIGVLSVLWFGAVAYAMGGVATTIYTIGSYLRDQSLHDSLVLAESARSWLRPLSRLVIWNAIAIVGWIWAPIVGYRYLSAKMIPWFFFLLWVGPGFLFQLMIHIAAPDHTLFATPVLCLTGAYCIYGLKHYRDAVMSIAMAVGAALFLNAVPTGYPAPANATPLQRVWTSLQNSVAYGTFETSENRLRWWDEMTEVSLEELRQFRASGANIVIALNGTEKEFDFVNWRVVSYYMDQEPFSVLMDNLPQADLGRIRRIKGKDVWVQEEPVIRLPRSGRVLWIMLPDGRFHRALERFIPVRRGRYILYSDISPGTMPFEIEGFVFLSD